METLLHLYGGFMKKLLIVGLFFLVQIIQTDNNCLAYVGRKLRKETGSRVKCFCNCKQQQKVWYDQGHGYGCARCGHRRIPIDVMTPENTRVITPAEEIITILPEKAGVVMPKNKNNNLR